MSKKLTYTMADLRFLFISDELYEATLILLASNGCEVANQALLEYAHTAAPDRVEFLRSTAIAKPANRQLQGVTEVPTEVIANALSIVRVMLEKNGLTLMFYLDEENDAA